jgi:hypothetical protein
MSTDDQVKHLAEAHAEGLHADLPCEHCAECKGREASNWPRAADVAATKNRSWPIA